MSISRTLLVLAVAAAPLAAQAQNQTDPVPAGDVPTVFRPTVEKDSLWTIVAPTVAAGRVTPSQAMVALLRQNPQAFVRGNLHLLRRGVALTMPSLAQIRAENRARSAELVEAHLQLLKERRSEAAPAPYELGVQPAPAAASAAAVAPRPAASVPAARPAASAAASAVAPRPAASKPEPRTQAASAVVAPPVKPAASKPEVQPAKPAASATPPAASAPAQVVTQPPRVRTEPASQAEVPASKSAQKPTPASAPVSAEARPPVAVAPPPAEPASAAPATEVETTTSAQVLGYGLGLLLLGGAAGGAWWWRARRPAQSTGKTERRERELPDLPSMRQPEAPTEAVETVRSLDAMQSALELVRPVDQPDRPAPDLAADTALKLELARAYIELRRHDEAYVLLQFVTRHGTEAQQQDAAELLRGSA
ncbi:MAG: hypothetical protein RJA44_1869 [Pseudomonadota bacterium]